MTSPLVTHPCQQRCAWRPTDNRLAGERLFRCGACGSQWVRSQPWAPVDADGTRHPALTAELDPHRRDPR
jgi:hypothetical protein